MTLAGYLFWFGVMIILLGAERAAWRSRAPSCRTSRSCTASSTANIDPMVGWIGLVVIVALLGATIWLRDAGRRKSGLVAPPVGLTVAKIASLAIAGIVVVAICNVNRGTFLPIVGVPWVVPLVLVVLGAWTILLERTQFGRHMYAVGGNAEAARRAGINVAHVRTIAFVLCSLTAGIAGVIYLLAAGGITTNINGGQLVLYAVAAAVIGGTSLFGGRGRAIHGAARRPRDRRHLQRAVPARPADPVAADRHRSRPAGRRQRRFAVAAWGGQREPVPDLTHRARSDGPRVANKRR